MIEDSLFIIYYALLLFFAIMLSTAYAGIPFERKEIWFMLQMFICCGILQLMVFLGLGEDMTWKLYPFITHIPLGFALALVFRKRFLTVLSAVTCAYLCCQPAKWFGILLETLSGSVVTGYITRIMVLLLSLYIFLFYAAPHIAELYNKENRNIFIFNLVPLVYYIFDYTIGIYTDLWATNSLLILEFQPFILCLAQVIFCVVYYREYEQKTDAERREHFIKIAIEQQSQEMVAIRESSTTARLLRHDMRFLLDSLVLSLEKEDIDTALHLISGYTEKVDAATVERYCENDTLNYVLTNFRTRCQELKIDFSAEVKLHSFDLDEILFASILSNALDNAVNAQKELPLSDRRIRLSLKNSDGRLLLSVKNPFHTPPVMVDGIPVTRKKGHGYGTQSIRYLTERLGGKYQFSVQGTVFIVRVII